MYLTSSFRAAEGRPGTLPTYGTGAGKAAGERESRPNKAKMSDGESPKTENGPEITLSTTERIVSCKLTARQ